MSTDMDDPDVEMAEPANLVFLRRLVTTLTAVMILGVVVIVALLVIRLQQPVASAPLPAEITLPDGSRAAAFTRGSDWYAVVTTKDEILIYDAATSALRQRIFVNSD